MLNSEERPQEPGRGWLRNGNPCGDFTKAPRCRAKTRRGSECQCPAMTNGRCRLHGGLSTGPKTEAGIRRIEQALTKHGLSSKQEIENRRAIRSLMRSARNLLHDISP
jgi:hypothetical protein